MLLFSTHGACDDAWMADRWAEEGLGRPIHRWGAPGRARGRGEVTHHHLDVALS